MEEEEEEEEKEEEEEEVEEGCSNLYVFHVLPALGLVLLQESLELRLGGEEGGGGVTRV